VARAAPLVHLIDGSVYVFRAYYSLPPMAAPDGTPTNAAYGYASSLVKYLADFEPSHVAVAFDHAMTSFRNEIFPAYKAQREETPEDLEPQFDLCKEATRALGVAVFEQPDYEADDLIASLTAGLVRRRARVRIVSTDKDLAQLVREDGRVGLYDLARRESLDADGVRGRFGVDPGQIPDYLGLMGDAVDNLPGVPGVGAKSAAAALRAFGRIENIPADPRAWAGVAVRGVARIAGLVDEHREQALRTRELATLRRDVPGVQATLRGLRYRGAQRRRAEALCERLGWGRLAARMLA
jgi:5'-3' exonuclease